MLSDIFQISTTNLPHTFSDKSQELDLLELELYDKFSATEIFVHIFCMDLHHLMFFIFGIFRGNLLPMNTCHTSNITCPICSSQVKTACTSNNTSKPSFYYIYFNDPNLHNILTHKVFSHTLYRFPLKSMITLYTTKLI